MGARRISKYTPYSLFFNLNGLKEYKLKLIHGTVYREMESQSGYRKYPQNRPASTHAAGNIHRIMGFSPAIRLDFPLARSSSISVMSLMILTYAAPTISDRSRNTSCGIAFKNIPSALIAVAYPMASNGGNLYSHHSIDLITFKNSKIMALG